MLGEAHDARDLGDRFDDEVDNAVRQRESAGLYGSLPGDREKRMVFRAVRNITCHRPTDILREALIESQIGCCTCVISCLDGLELLGESLGQLADEHSSPDNLMTIGDDGVRPWELVAVFTAFRSLPLGQFTDALEALDREISLAGVSLTLCFDIESEFERIGITQFAEQVANEFNIRRFEPVTKLVRKAFSDGATNSRLSTMRTWINPDELTETLRMAAVWLHSMSDAVSVMKPYLYEEMVELFQIEVPEETHAPELPDEREPRDNQVLLYLKNHGATSHQDGLRIRVINKAIQSDEDVAGNFKNRMMKLKRDRLVDSETNRARANRWWITDFGLRTIDAHQARNENR